jgi:hypothetical protein
MIDEDFMGSPGLNSEVSLVADRDLGLFHSQFLVELREHPLRLGE